MIIWNDKVVELSDGIKIDIDSIKNMTSRQISNLLFTVFVDGMNFKDEVD